MHVSDAPISSHMKWLSGLDNSLPIHRVACSNQKQPALFSESENERKEHYDIQMFHVESNQIMTNGDLKHVLHDNKLAIT